MENDKQSDKWFSIDTSNSPGLHHAEYRYRLKVKREQWVGYCIQAASEIDYSNVKGTIAHGDHERSKAYMGCWSALYKAQEETR